MGCEWCWAQAGGRQDVYARVLDEQAHLGHEAECPTARAIAEAERDGHPRASYEQSLP